MELKKTFETSQLSGTCLHTSPEKLWKNAKEFSECYPVGTPVMVIDDLGLGATTKITSKAWDVCGTLVVKLEGKTGGYDVSRIFSTVGNTKTDDEREDLINNTFCDSQGCY